jgi:hypothetical protein
MNPTSILNVSKPFEGWKGKAEQLLYSMYPQQFDEGRFSAIHVGANKDAHPVCLAVLRYAATLFSKAPCTLKSRIGCFRYTLLITMRP